MALLASAPAAAQQPPQADASPATPDLIEQAEERGAIDFERANLYRLYALNGDPRLPAAYESEIPWRGTLWWTSCGEACRRWIRAQSATP